MASLRMTRTMIEGKGVRVRRGDGDGGGGGGGSGGGGGGGGEVSPVCLGRANSVGGRLP